MRKKHVFYAGAGRADIAFGDDYFPIEGYDSLRDPLHARAVVMKQDITVLLISLELPSIRPGYLIDELREELSQQTGIEARHIWIAVTHSLSAPHVPQTNEERREPDADRKQKLHLEAVRKAMGEACKAALGSLKPAAVGVRSGNSNVIANRNIETAYGWWVGISDKGPSDKTLFVMKLETLAGEPIALIYNYALKSCVLEDAVMSDGKKYASADLCGAASAYVENSLHVPAVFFMGAAGDQVPRNRASYLETDQEGRPRKVELGEQGYDFLSNLGAQLGEDILNVADIVECAEDVRIFKHRELDITVPGQIRYPKEYPPPPVRHYDYPSAPDQIIHVEAIQINQDVIIGVKPEILTVTNMVLKRNSPFFHTLLFSMVNGGQDYIPEDQDYERFEYPALHATVAKGTDKIFLDAVVKWLRKMYHKQKIMI